MWSASRTAVSLGNGTVTGQCIQLGSLVWMKIVLTMGSTTTYGTNFWRCTLPVTPELNELLLHAGVSVERQAKAVLAKKYPFLLM